MKIAGKNIEKPNAEVIVIPRTDGDIIIKAKPVTDYEDFEKLCPQPMPKEIIKPGGIRIKDTSSKQYKEELDKWATNKAHYMILKSLEATEGLEWETVKWDDSDTWGNYTKELEDAGFLPIELARIMDTIQNACGLNQDKIDEATKAFLAMEQVANRPESSLQEDQ